MEPPEVSVIRRNLNFKWQEGPAVRVSQLYQSKDGVHGNIQVAVLVDDRPQHVMEGMLNMSAVQTRTQWQRRLAELQPDHQWYEVLETICKRSIQHIRSGKPPVWLDEVEFGPLEARLYPILYQRQPTILFGDGGSGKSTIALAVALAIATGGTFLGERAVRGNVLYLDWEADDQTMARRLAAIKVAQEYNDSVPVLYKRVYGLLSDQIDAIADLCSEYDIKVIIIDAMAKATADAPEGASGALQMFDAMDSLERDYLIIDHIDKAKATPGKPYGSVFKYNSARFVWFAETIGRPGENEIYVRLDQTKANDTAKHVPVPLRILFQDGQTVIERSDWADMPEEVKPKMMVSWDAISEALDGTNGLDKSEIQKATGLSANTVEMSLKRNKGKWVKRTVGGRAVYGLLDLGHREGGLF